MKISNYHTHTYLCKHATGTPGEFVSQAVKNGCLELGFSDHCPYPASFSDTWPHIRMSVEETKTYIEQIEEARKLADFPVYIGYECEYDKDYEEWYKELREHYKAQYLVLGSHWMSEGSVHKYCPELYRKEDINKYIDQTIKGMQSGLYDFLAHPDLFMKGYKEWDENSKAWLTAILEAAKELQMPIEINGLGMIREPNQTSRGTRFQYPYDEFWELVAQTDVPVICNADAHDFHDVIECAALSRSYAAKYGIIPIQTLNLQNK